MIHRRTLLAAPFALTASHQAAAPPPTLKPSPFLSQHEEEVLGRIFGFSTEERASLREAGAISVAGPVKG
jgi:hypothetical protein